ncbi:MAG: glycosyltransferase [Actinobacteria bacterium]|nr:glycosyltransferase [Actinomycetota bacterium]
MHKGRVVAAIVPCHNEAGFVGDVLAAMPRVIDHIIVVDDASTDATFDEAERVALHDSRVRVVRNEKNLGVGGAVVAGYRLILESMPDVEVIFKIDGDGQMPLERVPDLLDAIVEEGFDYAKGNRFLMGKELGSMPGSRLFGNFVTTFLTKFSSGYWNIFDVQNGFTALSRGVLERLDLSRIHRGYFFENDMLVHLNAISARVKDVPIPAIYGDEVSGVNIVSVGFTFPRLLIGRYWWRLYRKYMLYNLSPVAVFMLLGTILFGFGAIFSTYLWVRSSVSASPTPTGTIMIALVSVILGFQLILQSVVLDIQESDRLR